MRSHHPSSKTGICIYYHRDWDISIILQELFAFKNDRYHLFKRVFELMVGDKLCNFIALYKSPSQSQDQLESFKENLELNLELAVQNSPFLVVALSDLNATSSNWYKSDITMIESKAIANISAQFGIHQVINEPTHLLLLHVLTCYSVNNQIR